MWEIRCNILCAWLQLYRQQLLFHLRNQLCSRLDSPQSSPLVNQQVSPRVNQRASQVVNRQASQRDTLQIIPAVNRRRCRRVSLVVNRQGSRQAGPAINPQVSLQISRRRNLRASPPANQLASPLISPQASHLVNPLAYLLLFQQIRLHMNPRNLHLLSLADSLFQCQLKNLLDGLLANRQDYQVLILAVTQLLAQQPNQLYRPLDFPHLSQRSNRVHNHQYCLLLYQVICQHHFHHICRQVNLLHCLLRNHLAYQVRFLPMSQVYFPAARRQVFQVPSHLRTRQQLHQTNRRRCPAGFRRASRLKFPLENPPGRRLVYRLTILATYQAQSLRRVQVVNLRRNQQDNRP